MSGFHVGDTTSLICHPTTCEPPPPRSECTSRDVARHTVVLLVAIVSVIVAVVDGGVKGAIATKSAARFIVPSFPARAGTRRDAMKIVATPSVKRFKCYSHRLPSRSPPPLRRSGVPSAAARIPRSFCSRRTNIARVTGHSSHRPLRGIVIHTFTAATSVFVPGDLDLIASISIIAQRVYIVLEYAMNYYSPFLPAFPSRRSIMMMTQLIRNKPELQQPSYVALIKLPTSR